jgi:hypothetical protein
MNFEDIKHNWNSSFEKEDRLDREQIEQMLKIKSKSNTALKKIKNSFKFELISGGLLYLLIVIGIFVLIKLPSALIFFLIVTLLMGIPILLYYRNYKRIRYTVYTDGSIKQSLAQTIKDIEKFVMIGKGISFKLFLIPAATFVGMLMGLIIGTGNTDLIEILLELETRSIVKMIVILASFTGILVPFSRYWFKKKFKHHYDNLRLYLKEFEEFEFNKHQNE